MTNSGAHQIQIINCLIVFPQVLRLELSLSVNPLYFFIFLGHCRSCIQHHWPAGRAAALRGAPLPKC